MSFWRDPAFYGLVGCILLVWVGAYKVAELVWRKIDGRKK